MNQNLIPSFINKKDTNGFIYPDYQNFCLSNSSLLISALLTGKKLNNTFFKIVKNKLKTKPKNIIFIIFDGLGYSFLEKIGKKIGFFKKISQSNKIIQLTSVFPSTTSAAMSAYHTGVTPANHGLLEWWVYYKELDKVIKTLPFTNRYEPKSNIDQLLKEGANPNILIKSKTIYEKLKFSEVISNIYLPKYIHNTAYTSLISKGAKVNPYENYDEIFSDIIKKIKPKTKNYFFVYVDTIDTASHDYGPYSTEHKNEIINISKIFDKQIINLLKKHKNSKTQLFFSADHGQTKQPPEKLININSFPDFLDCLAVSKSGEKILPWGGPRDAYFLFKPKFKKKGIETLKRIVGDKGLVINSKKLYNSGIFGPLKKTNTIQKRLGDAAVLMKDEYTIWCDNRVKKGGHGGLTQEEMIIPFGFIDLDKYPV